MEPMHDEQQEIYRLVKENNRMLHAMRRGAFLGKIFKFVLWAAVFLVSAWFYVTYLAPVLEQMMKTVQQVQGTSAQAQAQFGSFQEMLKQLQQKFPSGQ